MSVADPFRRLVYCSLTEWLFIFEMEKLFSYGTLRNHEVQTELFGRDVPSRRDTLNGYGIQPIEIGGETHKLAVIDEDSSIKGRVLELSKEELAVCDFYEPAPYERIEVMLASGETAWAYVAAN
jgi:gamma-glutamylcyclotransferase (GGCT)/AIG2-like uncharacterized protein YtfP